LRKDIRYKTESKGIMELETFLKSLDLDYYRDQYRAIKIVEMDLPKAIWALDSMYQIYWIKREQLSFEDFFAHYKESLKPELDNFCSKIMMCESCFYKGLPARIYRTWTALLTQIHGGMVAESVFGIGNVQMSTELDQMGIDIKVTLDELVASIQVKKITNRKEARQSSNRKKIVGMHFDISYRVLSNEVRLKPYKKNGEPKKEFREFESEYYKLLSNGFVLFTDKYFREIRFELLKAQTT
jgi:hypothetical protein